MNRVPGYFFITTADFLDIITNLENEGHYTDMSFTVAHFSFGKKSDFKSIKDNFPNTDVHHPLDGFSREATYSDARVNRKG